MDKEAPRITEIGRLYTIIKFKFFKKSMANKLANKARNGLPEQTKMKTAVQEIPRRMKNSSRECEDSVIEGVIKDYMNELKSGGYTLEWRTEALKSAVKGYSRMWRSEARVETPINRPSHSTETKRRARFSRKIPQSVIHNR